MFECTTQHVSGPSIIQAVCIIYLLILEQKINVQRNAHVAAPNLSPCVFSLDSGFDYVSDKTWNGEDTGLL